MSKTPAFALALFILAITPTSVFAQDAWNTQDCGRWVPCPPETGIGINARSWVYGNTRDVEPWIPMEKPVKKRRKQKPAPDSGESATGSSGVITGAGTGVGNPGSAENLISADGTALPGGIQNISSGDGQSISFSPAEEAAVRAYLDEIDKNNRPGNVLNIGAIQQPVDLSKLTP